MALAGDQKLLLITATLVAADATCAYPGSIQEKGYRVVGNRAATR